MDFGLSDEQRLFEGSLGRFLDESLPPSRVRAILETETGHDPVLWKALAEMGAVGVLVPEALGGGGLGLLDAALAAEQLARAAAPVPFLATSVLAPAALLAGGTPEQREAWLPRIASGECCVGAAIGEVIERRDDAGVFVEGGRLRGRALFAIDAGAAEAFLVAAGPGRLAWVPRDAPGLAVEPLPTVDRTRRLAELGFEGVEPEAWVGGADPRAGARALLRMRDAGWVALAADALGACERAIEMAVEYARQRRQFGRTIGSFQAVKHLCAEMIADLEPARSLVWYAAYAWDALPDQASRAAAHAKAHLAEIGTRIVRTATEVHGGIGFTEEHDLHLWFKRVGLDRQLLGGPDRVRAEAARARGWEPA
jgi:alkylation response protein AidB-like acyl-CoA dehydrogenase